VANGARGHQQVVANGRTLNLHSSPLRGAHGETLGTVLVLDDVTEVRALEEQVQRAQRLAALGRLAGGLAHEIRNPLGIVRAAAQILGGELRRDQHLGEYTQVIQTEVDRVDRLIEQLLAYARPRPLMHGVVQTHELIERAVSLTRPYAAQQGVDLTAEEISVLPPLHGDGELLHQALVNLVMNAIQASERGGAVVVRGAVTASGEASRVQLEIRDNGRGIAPDDRERIFDPFFTTRDDGVGLGLSIVQQIVHEHGGTIDVTSEPGVGSVFTVQFPMPDSPSTLVDDDTGSETASAIAVLD
jgi:signal transduction histidine kinase